MVLDLFETMHSPVRSWTTCKLPCCEKKYGVEVKMLEREAPTSKPGEPAEL